MGMYRGVCNPFKPRCSSTHSVHRLSTLGDSRNSIHFAKKGICAANCELLRCIGQGRSYLFGRVSCAAIWKHVGRPTYGSTASCGHLT